MAGKPVFPSPMLSDSQFNAPEIVPPPLSNTLLTIDPFARSSAIGANIPDDAFHNRGRPKAEPLIASPPIGRERTIPIKVETQKYSDVSKYKEQLRFLFDVNLKS